MDISRGRNKKRRDVLPVSYTHPYMINSLQSSIASVERIFQLLDEEEIRKDPSHPAEVLNAEGYVEFCHVKFGYTKEHILMDDISFAVKPGRCV